MQTYFKSLFLVSVLFITFGYDSAHASIVLSKVSPKPVAVEDPKTNVQWDPNTNSFWIGDTNIKVGVDMECGYVNNQSLYASFGLEEQIFKFTRILLPVTLTYKQFVAHIGFAPIYDSIRVDDDLVNRFPVYGNDSQGRPIKSNPYIDWYKNLGTQVYYLGEYPLLQAYVGLKFFKFNEILFGRLKDEIGLKDSNTPWGNDGMFAPYAYWLSRNLLTGVSYQFYSKFFEARIAVTSGNNPMKGYPDYLGHIQGPNLKGNNTQNMSGDLYFNFGRFINEMNTSKLVIGALKDSMSSTWAPVLQNGKRLNNVYAGGGVIDWPFMKDWRLNVFGQYTIYQSGLTTDSLQYNPSNLPSPNYFLNIQQEGYFAGMTLTFRTISLSYTHEKFDRFDYNIYKKWVDTSSTFNSGTTLASLKAMKQRSNILNASYKFFKHATLKVNYMHIRANPEWVSEILDNRPNYRVSALLNITF